MAMAPTQGGAAFDVVDVEGPGGSSGGGGGARATGEVTEGGGGSGGEGEGGQATGGDAVEGAVAAAGGDGVDPRTLTARLTALALEKTATTTQAINNRVVRATPHGRTRAFWSRAILSPSKRPL